MNTVFHIGDLGIDSPVLLAPMAGVTDLPFRRLCRYFGAGLTTSEMITSDTRLWNSRKSSTRLAFESQSYPVSMQIAGSDPEQLAKAAQHCVALGAQIVDINMGCPAKKVCKKLAGSALLADEALVKDILEEVTRAVSVPVTLKTRTGSDTNNKNIARIAKIAVEAGIKALAIHGRTRACRFNGQAEYDAIAGIASELSIPVLANGDITSPQKAKQVMAHTGATGLLIGRAALGAPWVFRDINMFLSEGKLPKPLSLKEKHQVILGHIVSIHAFYGDEHGVRIARKHFSWYCEGLSEGLSSRKTFNQLHTVDEQINHINIYFQWLKLNEDKAA